MQEENEDVAGESPTAPAPSPFSTKPRLFVAVLWGLAPGILMSLAGVCMEFRISGLDAVCLFTGFFGGPVILLLWSLRILWPADLKTVTKVLWAIPMTIGACVVNLFLAAGACSMIDPPFLH